jgi:hypothetical protein
MADLSMEADGEDLLRFGEPMKKASVTSSTRASDASSTPTKSTNPTTISESSGGVGGLTPGSGTSMSPDIHASVAPTETEMIICPVCMKWFSKKASCLLKNYFGRIVYEC